MTEEELNKAVDNLKEMIKIQTTDGNWNYDPYMHGMANGMIFALHLFQEGELVYLEQPEVWLRDLQGTAAPSITVEDDGDV